jgi:hypothetical protein
MALLASTFALRIASAEEETEPSGTSSAPGLTTNAHVNAAGLLLFGVTPTLELGKDHWGTLARVRLLSTGLLAHSIIPDADNTLQFSWGAAVGLRYYQASNGALTGFHGGLAAEYLRVRLENESLAAETLTGLVVPQLEAGYRWRFADFLFGLGGAVGYSIVMSRGVNDLSGGTGTYDVVNNATNDVFASAAVDVGYFF